MTPKQISLVQDSWKRVQRDPSLRRLLKGHPRVPETALLAIITVAVNSLERLDAILPAMQVVGRRHLSFGDALQWTLQGLGEAFTAEVKQAWAAAYFLLADTMKDAARNGGGGLSPMDRYQDALDSLWLGRGDALALARQADFVPARILEATLLACSRDVRDFEAAGWAYARLSSEPMERREAGHLAALAAIIDGDLALACRLYDGILREDPRDTVALWAAQVMDYHLGNPLAQLARSARVLEHWSESLPGYHAVLAMHAFALGESGDYAASEDAAQRALALEPGSVRAEHALLHVFEMQGRAEEGLRRISRHPVNHLAWHRALFHLQLGRPDRALALYDGRMRLAALPDLIDASALLWRLRLDGVDTGARFQRLAARWAEHADDAFCAFNDMHAMMAFAGASRWDLAQRLLSAQERRLERLGGANHDMTRLVGHPASRALAAFARGEWRAAEALLRSLPPVAHRIGGSHAQRDVLALTRAAALRRARTIPGDFSGAYVSQGLAAA